MANERNVDLILKAQIDQALQPLAQVTSKVRDLIQVLNQQRDAAKTGDTTLGEYAKALRDVEKASGDLLKQRAALDNFATRGQKVDTQQNVVDAARQRRDAFAASLPSLDDRTTKDAAALSKLDKAVEGSQKRLDTLTIAYQKSVDQLERLGVLTEALAANQQRLRVDQAGASISQTVLEATQALSEGQAVNDTLIQMLRLAGVEKQLAGQRARDTREFQAEQGRLAQAVTAVWQAEDAAAQKARENFLAFQATVEKAVAGAGAAVAHAASQTALLGAPVNSPAPTLAAQVRSLVAPPSAPGTGQTDLVGLQLRIAKIEAKTKDAASGFKEYTQGLKDLDNVSREVVRQSQIVDAFQKQAKAAREALLAVRDAAEELKRLEAVAAQAKTPEQVSEVTSAIQAQRRKIGSVSEGTGLLGDARAQQEALAREQAALASIGVGADEVSGAITKLTQVAISTSTTRTDILRREKATFDATADDIVRRAQQLSVAATTAGPSAKSAVAAVSGVSRGGAEIADTSAAVTDLEATMSKGRLTAQSYNKVMDEVFAVQSQIAKDATLIDQFNAQTMAVNRAKAAYTQAQAEVLRLAAAVKTGTADLEALRRAEAALNGAAGDLQRQANLQAQLDAALKARKIDTAALDAETQRLVATMGRLTQAQNGVQQGSSKILGLSAYQFQNLQFQVNDVITQLSLGQGVLRTFEAQAGQIFQIFDLSITAMQRIALYGAPAAAIIITIGLALLRLKDSIDAQRQFQSQLQLSSDGAAYQAAALTKVARTIEGYGVAFGDARDAVKGFIRDGLRTDTMLEFAKAAVNISDVTGGKFTEVLKQVGVIANGSMEDILKLNEAFGFLHEGEAQAIRDSFQFSDGSAGRTIALNALATNAAKARAEGIDPLTQGTKNLTQAWHDFLDAIGSTQLLTGLLGIMTNLTKAAAETANALRYILNPTQGEANLKVTVLQQALKDIKNDIALINQGKQPSQNETLEVLTARARELQNQINIAIAARDKLAATGATVPGLPAVGAPGSEVTSRSPSAVALTHLGENASQVAPFLAGQNINPLVDAWCAAFANAALQQAGLQGSGSNVATSFEKWGQSVAAGAIQAGDILVQARGHPAGETGGHVGIATGNFKTGPDGALLVEMVSGNLGGRVDRSFERADTLDARRAAGVAGGAALPGNQRQPGLSNEDAIKNQAVLDDITKRQAQDTDSLLRGNERLLQDQQKVTAFVRQRNQEINAQLGGTPRSPEVVAAFNAEIDKFQKKLQDAREKEEREASNTATQILKSAQEAVDKADKTNPAAQRRAVETQFDAQLSALNNAIANGATTAAGQTAEAARAGLLKLRQQAIENATVEADKAIVDAIVKTRDEKITGIETDLKSGAITLGTAFDQVTTVIKTFGPRIQDAIAKSNADLSAQPQTAKVQEQLAANAKINVAGSKAFADIDSAAFAQINALISARTDKVKDLNDQVVRGTITQREADAEIQQAYAKVNPQLNGLIDATRAQIEAQKEAGVINEATYEKLIAQLQKAQTETTTLTSFQRELGKTLEGSIERNAVQAFDTIGQAIGNVVAGTGKWSDVLKAVGTAFTQFAAGILKDLAAMIIKWEVLNLVQSAGGGSGIISSLFGAGGAAAGGATAAGSGGVIGGVAQSAIIYHAGGLVGSGAASRVVDMSIFRNARRFHNGGMPGLSPGEVPVITQQGEEILSSKDPRHRNNFQPGQNTGPQQSIRNILLLDANEVAGAMSGSSGEKVVFSHIKRNAPAIRQLLGGR